MTTKKFDDLLIFGYACKLFRDDEKALHIDQGRQLIPWMGDSTLKIDRYDVRAALTDISKYEPPPGGYDNRLDYLSAAEQRAEQLCEEERYFSLYNNDFEEELYKEESQKRQKPGYGQVNFSYDQSPSSQNDAEESKAENDMENKDEPPEEPYVPHPRFYIPPNMELPESLKIQAIIEKTAKFISTQGPQMEILIKAKQANNPMFDFLNQSGRLNPFYKHTLQSMKDGNYPTEEDRVEPITATNNIETQGSMYQNYYSASQSVQVPAIKYKPSADCAYTQLISKIKGVPILPDSNFDEQSSNNGSNNSSPSYQPNDSKPAANQPKNNVEVKKISSGLMLAQYYNSDSDEDEDDEANEHTIIASKNNNHTVQSNKVNIPLVPSMSDENSVPPGILCPPPELRVIVDKTASYVLKNGKEFEDIIRAKNEQRFSFLQYKDPYYKYYTYKVTGIVCPDPIQVAEDPSGHFHKNSSNKKTFASKPGPVSFTIKPKEDATPTALKPALPMEHSSDEEVQIVESNVNKVAQNAQPSCVQLVNQPPPNSVSKTSNGNDSLIQSDVDQSDSFIRDTILELPTNNLDEKKQLKRAEEKVKDRLAQLAREKLGILSKEKQLQLERKKRAMAFLNQINGDETTEPKQGKKDLVSSSDAASKSTKKEDASDHSDSSDSVTFVMATTSSSVCAAASRAVQKRRNIRSKRRSSGSDDVIEIDSKHSSRSRSKSKTRLRSRSRSRSKTSSSRRYHHKSKRSKKKTSRSKSKSISRNRSRSRSRSNRYSRSSSRDHKRKRRGSPSKSRKHRYSDD